MTGAPKALISVKRALRRVRSSLWGDECGVTAIEFAITLPVLLLIVFGTLEFGRVLLARNEMSHALSKAVRVVNLDSEQSTDAVAELLKGYLSGYGEGDLSVNVSSTTVSGTNYMEIAVAFPFDVIIPLSSISTVTLNVSTRAPVISPTK